MTALPATAERPEEIGAITGRVIHMALAFSSFGTTRKLPTDRVETTGDRKLLALSKRLLDCPELKAIAHLDNAIKTFVRAECLPGFFRAGFYLVPVVRFPKVIAQLKQFRAERADLVAAFLAVYPAAVESMRDRLGDLWRAADYPTLAEVAACFEFSWQCLSFDAPETLKAVSAAVFDEEKAKIAESIENAGREIRALVRAEAQELFAKLADRLAVGPDGKPKVFRESALTAMSEFLDRFSARNVTDDRDLAALAKEARALMAQVPNAEALRENLGLRATVQAGFAALDAKLEPLTRGRLVRFAKPA